MTPRLVLGTAQFGAAYGVTNAIGRLSDDDVSSLLRAALDAGIDTFDTASDYGDSQLRLGSLAPAARRYVTKFSLPAGQGAVTADDLYARSARMLGVDTLAGVMFHKLADLADPRLDDALAVLREARRNSLVERIGVSVYDAADLDMALTVFPDLDLVQLPANVFDSRLLNNATVARLHDAGVEIHVRSAFLQGILLASPESLPEFFEPLQPALRELNAEAAKHGTTVLGLALRHLRDHPLVDGVVVGATTAAELAGIASEWAAPGSQGWSPAAGVPTEMLDPRRWPAVKVAS